MPLTFFRPVYSLLSLIPIVWGLSIYSCSSPSKSEASTEVSSTSTQELFDGTLDLQYAQKLKLTYHHPYYDVSIYHTSGSRIDTLTYTLIPKGKELPPDLTSHIIIQTPIKRLITTSTSQIAMVTFAYGLDHLIGTTDTAYIVNEEVRRRLSSNRILSLGSSQQLDVESIIALEPELVLLSGLGGDQQSTFNLLKKAGIPVITQIEWQESNLLASAEWAKLMGLLFHKEKEVNDQFQVVASAYEELVASIPKTIKRPQVIWGLPYKGTWFVGGGNSYVAQLIEHAGGQWPWQEDTSSISIPLDLEAVLPLALEADFWLNVNTINSEKDLLSVDARFKDFKPVQNHQVYNNNAQMNTTGLGNAYWESGVVAPHHILADLIHILHPDILPDHEFVYYKHLE